jgi:hypothetical protein
MRVNPLEYYKLRSSTAKLNIVNLNDNYGHDERLSHYPHIRTHISEKLCLEFPELVKQHITNGEKLLEILKEETEWNNKSGIYYPSSGRLLLKWEYITGLEENITKRDRHMWKDMLERFIKEQK